ncbi:MAG TPA: M81 family metallopeptidase [Burkholderiales bacterium]|nr:M81 family metallopeptidase [Burkholderiales bacterium]
MPKRFVIAQIKHETNTFSPIATEYESFGHGNGPVYGEEAKRALAGTNSPFAAFLDVAVGEGAEAVTPIAAESWPSNKASRQAFERLVRPLEDAVRAGCDAVLLDLHGAMVVEGADDAEGEILMRVRRIAPEVPIAVALDYHTNLSPDIVANATVIAGYKTYPHVDMYETGRLAGALLARKLRGEIDPVIAWGWLPLVPSIMRHAPEDGPSGDIVDLAREAERDGRVLAATLLPAFAHADTPYTGCSAVVVADTRRGGKAAAQNVCDAMLKIAWDRRDEYVYRSRPLADALAEAARIGNARPAKPVLLIDHCDNCGSGGAQDVMTVVGAILEHGLEDVAIAPIRDPEVVSRMVEAGVGANVTLALGGKTDMPSIGLGARPIPVSGRVRTITDGEIVFTGPMYTGVRSSLGRSAVLDTGRAEIVVTERHHEPFDLVILRHFGIEPTAKRFIMLKSRVHYRAGFKPIAAAIVECQGEGVTNADLSVFRYEKLRRPIYPLDPL